MKTLRVWSYTDFLYWFKKILGALWFLPIRILIKMYFDFLNVKPVKISVWKIPPVKLPPYTLSCNFTRKIFLRFSGFFKSKSLFFCGKSMKKLFNQITWQLCCNYPSWRLFSCNIAARFWIKRLLKSFSSRWLLWLPSLQGELSRKYIMRFCQDFLIVLWRTYLR